MKKQHKTIKSFLCGVVCFATMLSCMSAFTAPVFSAPAGYNSEVASTYSRLQNTYAKIKNGETVNVAYLGGSVTNGYAGNGMDCQSNGKSWRALTFKWLSETFKTQVSSTATFVQNHCAIGGTGSDLNNYRVANALKFGTSGMADLAFIEFAINDSYELLNYEKSKQYMETIVRKCLTANPNMDIVIVITTDNGDEKKNKEFANAKAHADVAVAYDLPYIYLGKHMWDFLLTKNSNPLSIWSNYYADGCHPHEGGHAKYYDFILNNILVPELEKAQEIGTTTLTAKTLPTEWQTNDRYINSHEVLISQLESFNGFGFDGTAGSSNLNTTTGGASFKLNFKGTGIGVRFTGSNKSGVGRYRIDGGEWKDYNFYKSGSGTEHIMLEEDLSYGEHTMDFIVRKTTNGSYLRIDSFFINGDPEKTPLSFGTPPNNVPISEELKVNVVINPNELNTVISGGGFTNTGSTMSFVESEVDDVDTLKYVPNQSSADVVASDLYNSKLLSVNNTEYKYAIIGYHYLVPDGVTSTAENMALNFLNLPLTPKSKAIPSANKIQKNIGDTLIFDLSYFKAKGMNAKFKQLHIYPFGYNVKGNQTNEGEIMHIKHLTFVSDYPFATPDAIIETSDIGTTSGATVAPSTYNGTDVIKVTANGEAYLLAESLDAKELLPSVYKYAMIEYYSDSAAKPVLEIPTTDAGVAVSATGKIINGENGLKKAIFNLSEITENGQYNFYKDAKLYPFGKASSSDVMDIKSFAFYASYPDPNAMFDATFNLNGGVGDVPSSFSGKLGDKIIFPACNAKNGDKVFVGWSTKPTDTSFVSEYYMPEGGIDFYAIWAEPVIKYVSATDTSISYNGESHAVDHTSLADAISALDKNGGIIIMTGSQPFTALNGITNDALTVSIIGADETAKLTGYTSNYNLKSPLSFENITFVCENTSSNPHFFGGGYKLTIGKNCKMIKGEALSRFEIVAGNGSVASSTIELSSATYGCISATYAQNYNGTNTYIINDGTYNTALELGLRSTPSGTFIGNAILVVNGGVFNAGKTINCTGFVEGTGARVAVFNNDTASKTSFSLNFDYVVKSGSGGSVSVTENPTATKAPTFKAKAVGNYPIKINGVQVGVGEYTFTPSEKGTTVVTYDVPYRTITFDANGGTGTAPEQYTALIGESISLPQTTTLTNGSATFLGWSTDPAESLPITEYTVGDSDVTFYAIWAGVNTFCVNPTGDTIVVAGKTLPAPYKSLTDAANAMTSAGGTIFFTGTLGTGTSNEFNEALAKVSTTNKVILEGVGTDARYELQCQTVNLRCNLEYRNLTIVNQHSDPFMYSNGYKIVVGRPGVENDVKVVKADNTPEAIRFFGPGGDVTINSGRYGEKFNMSGYGGNKNVNARLTVNGGNFFHSSGVNGGFYNFGSAAYTLTGNSTVIINGGTFTNPTVVWRFTGSVTGKKTAIFNNDLASTLGFTAPDADIIIRSTTDGMVSELSAGTSFLVTPKNEELIPQVNGVAMTKDTNDQYVLTPASNGTYDITYQAPAAPEQSTVTFDANGGEGTVPHEKNGNVGSKVDLPVANLTKAGCRFVGWATTPDAPVALKTYTFPEGGATLYAVWEQQGKYYINSDGSGELTVDGVRHTAYTTLIEAGNAMTAEGGIVYFAGAIGTGTSNEGTKAFSHVTGKVIIEGVGTDATFNLELLGVEFHCDTELRNLTLSRSGDCYIYARGNELTIGEYGVENDIKNSTTNAPKLVGISGNGNAFITVNSGTFDNDWSGTRIFFVDNATHTGNSLLVINGGTFVNASKGINGGCYVSGGTSATLNGNATVSISGGSFKKALVEWSKTNVTGKKTAIFNNDVANTLGFTAPDADYVIKSTADGMVSELVSGTSFLVTPKNEALIPNVNGVAMTKNSDGQYVLTPSENGTYEITYAQPNVAKTLYVNTDGSGTLVVDGVSHPAYTTLIEAGNAMNAKGGIVYFAGTIGTGTNNEGTKAFSHVTDKVIIEGVGTDATFNLELLGVEFFCDTELRNLTLSRSGDCYIYANGNELTMGEYGVENDIRMDVTMSPKLIGITENGEAKIVVNSGTFDSSFSGMRYVYSNTEHTGNFLYVINGGELKSAQTFNVGAIAFGENMMTKYTGNSTVIISGGKFHNNPTIAWNKITTMVGKRTAIFNNDMYTSAGFNSSKANYTIDSAVGGMVSELVSGTSFLVTPNEGLIPRVNGTPLTLNGDGQYVFTPEADGKYDITYTASADSYHAYGSIVIERTYGDGEAYNIEGYNSGAVLTIFSENGEKTVVNESSMTVSEHTSGKAVLNFEVALEQGTYSYTLEKNGYIMQSDSFIIENGKDTALPTITLIGGDIKESYEAVDGDGIVDLDDFIRLLRAFSAEVDAKYRSITDIDESGETSIEDIAVIKTNFNAENEYIEEINITQFIEGEYVNKADGTFVAYTGWKRTDYINLGYAPMLLETFCNAEGGNLNWNCFYDKDKNFISAFSLGRTVAVPANAKYVIFSIQSSKTLSANLISKKRVTADIVYKPNCYIDNKNGNEVAYPNWHSTDFIEIKHPSKQLVTKSNSVSYDAIYNAFYDKDKKFISSFSLNSTVDVPIKAKYIRISQLAWKELAVELILLPPVEAKRLNTKSLIAQEFDIAPYIKEKTYIETDGREVAYSFWYSTVLTEIPLGAVAIQADTEHPYDHGYNAFYDANGNFITTFYQKKYVEIPKNAKYFRLSTSNSATLDVKFYTLNDDDSDFLNGGTPMERIAIKIPEYYTEVPASANASYLDTKIEEVPKNAKSFFFITDVHWASNAQKSNHIMAYIKAKTGIKKVLHGGDIINIHKDKPDEAVNAIKLWVDEARSYFGGDLLVAPGNHDNNTGYGGNDETVIQNSYMSYKQERYALLDGYENAIVQETDEQILARLASVNFESEEDKENMIAYYKLHYYADDDENGVRYVVMNFGTLFSGIVNKYFGINQYSENYLHMDWLYETFMSTPEGYDIVLVNHTMVRYGDHQLVGAPKVTTVLAHGMKAKNANTVAYNSKDIGEVYPMGDHIYDFSKAPNVGKIIFLGGDMHWDYSGKVSYEDGQYVCTEIESGTTISENDILIVHTQTDGVGVSSYNNIYIREPYTMTRGTVTEQCFDVVSIEDSKVTFTRVGAGHSRVYNYAE